MDYYSIVDFNIAIHENFDKKATLLLKAFKIDTSSTAENKEECVVQIVHVNSDVIQLLQRRKNIILSHCQKRVSAMV